MSRSGYTDDCDDILVYGRWRGAVKSALRSRRGQAFLQELIDALDAMPDKRLGADALRTDDGAYCALGVVGQARGLDLEAIDPEEREEVAQAFGIDEAMAAEIMYENDTSIGESRLVTFEIFGPMIRPSISHSRTVRIPRTDVAERRWQYMRDWAAKQLRVT